MARGTCEHRPCPSLLTGRLYIAVAAVLWSTSGAFTKILTKPTPLDLHDPPVTGLQIACFRVLFASLIMLPLLRPRDVSFRPLMLVMVASFTFMNATFVSAMTAGTAANAILLQYTAPMWMFLACVFWLGEKADMRSLVSLLIGTVGIAVIVVGGWQEAKLDIIAIGLGSGVGYAGVLVCLRVLRDASPQWLTTLNHLTAGLILVPFVWHLGLPTPGQLVILFLFGSLQMGLPYLLVARGLRAVSPQEAGTITLLEPILNPVWAYLISGEQPSGWTLVGGMFILAALAWRYWPVSTKR